MNILPSQLRISNHALLYTDIHGRVAFDTAKSIVPSNTAVSVGCVLVLGQ